MSSTIELPINLKLERRFFPADAINGNASVRVTFRSDLVDASYRLPSYSTTGVFYNNSVGLITWKPVADLVSTVEVDTITTTPIINLSQLGTGDSALGFQTVSNSYVMGIDNDADQFKISNSTALGTNDIVTVLSTGMNITGDLNVSGTITGNRLNDVADITVATEIDDTYTIMRVTNAGAAYDITLPASNVYPGIKYHFIRRGGGNVVNIIINPTPGTDFIDNALTSVSLINEHDRITLIDAADGQWYSM